MRSFTGGRAGDLGSVLTDEVRWLPGEEGVIISLMKGKTIDISDPRVIIIYNSVNTEFCPVTVLRDYIECCKVSKLEIVGGYLFRPLASSFVAFSDVPFTSAAANARLKSFLTDLNIWEGETPNSTRSGCALTLTWLGINVDVVHVEQDLREVKEYAARSREINADTLQLKRMHLDEVARRVCHQDRELYSMVLHRFLCHKHHERVEFLVTSFLSSPAENKLQVFEKEQKFLKVHGNENLSTKQQKDETETKNPGNKSQFQQFAMMIQCMQSVFNPRPSTPFMTQRFA
ncbi:unnamed protein product [Mytilus coruscus]|uniref:Uncharacterized protein n=1 Tax=Mytilus coruscus TaxID=42192 RepID=A0A6J8E7Y8_MYTCO|nr:unnamed protein product [Mytilus coruscus]